MTPEEQELEKEFGLVRNGAQWYRKMFDQEKGEYCFVLNSPDVINALLAARRELAEAKNQLQNNAANAMPTSFVKMKWACGHEGGASCVQCFEEKCRELAEERILAAADQKTLAEQKRQLGYKRENAALKEGEEEK